MGNTKAKLTKLTIIMLLVAMLQLVTSSLAVEEYTVSNNTITKYKGDVENLVIPDTINGQKITAIGEFAFNFNSKLITVTIPGTIEHIQSGAFCHCKNLKEIKVSKGTLGIGSGAFRGLTGLTKVELPETITYLEDDAFLDSATNYTIIAPQYKLNGSTIEETEVSKLAKKLGQGSSVTYTPTNYAVFITQPQNGKITVSKQIVKTGDTITITVTPNKRYKVEKVTYKLDGGAETELAGNQITVTDKNITITATLNHKTHEITSSAGVNGTISPSGITTVLEGNNQAYQITPDTGYAIDTITIDGEVLNKKPTTYTFTNVEGSHEIEVTFKEIKYHTLTTNISNIIQTTIEKQEDQEITIKTGTTTNFISWTTTGIDNSNARALSFAMPTTDVTVTYNYSEPNYNTTVIETTPTIIGEKATATLNQSELSNKIATTESDTIEIQVEKVSSETEVEVTIPKTNIQEITAKENIKQLNIATEVGTLSIQKDALTTIKNQATGTNIVVTIKECDESDLTESQKAEVGNRPVYKLEITSNGTIISEFNGNIIITVPYTPKSGENTNSIVVYYIAKDGTLEKMPTVYKNGKVSFTTTHFSEYFIESEEKEDQNPDEGEPEIDNPQESDKEEEKENTTSKKKRKNKEETKLEEVQQQIEQEDNTYDIELNYIDIKENAWYINAIKYVVKNNIASGTTKDTFSPSTPITRGQAITMLCKAYNIEEEYTGENFVDAGNTYYTGYIQALKNKKLIAGVGDNKVEPKREMTRQELLVLVYKLVEYTNNKKEINEFEGQETNYEDKNEISIWAKEAVEYFIKTKVIVGNNGKINPRKNITRAETVQIIYNLNK